MNQRPVVVSIIAALLLLNGFLDIIYGYLFQAPGYVYVMLLGAVAIVLSAGMWQLWSWAWVGTVLLQIGAIGYALYDWFAGGPIDFLAMIIGAIVLIYLFQAKTRSAFFDKEPAATENTS